MKNKMSEFFLELFSEEMPANLQSSARESLKKDFIEFFTKEKIVLDGNLITYSTPNRLIVLANINKEIVQEAVEIRGPSTNAPEIAINGFIKSNQIERKDLILKKTDKGEFFFYKKKEKKIKTSFILERQIPNILDSLVWKKSMKWGDHSLFWGRPLKSILAVFDKKTINFNFKHLQSSNLTFIDKDFEEKSKKFNSFDQYNSFFKSKRIIINNDKRKKQIEYNLIKFANKKKLSVSINKKLLEEVSDLVEKPNIILCEFDKRFLKIPSEIIKITIQKHQKYFPIVDKKEELTNKFFVVADNLDLKNFIKTGNERVVEARLNDAEFFWNKNKSQNLVKQVSMLKNINYFKDLGSYFDKIQRMKKLGGLISDEFLISKEKIEISSTICKVDLLSDLVGEFPELQGTLGGYFAEAQGFDKEVCFAIKEHYLPTGAESKIPKKPYSIALSMTDKIDTLVGFFGINLKPSSSKDPYALRRLAFGLVKIIIENKKQLKITDLINYSCQLYNDQSLKFDNKKIQKELSEFLIERFRFFMKEKNIRQDIISSSAKLSNLDNIIKIFNKALTLNNSLKKETGIVVLSNYKRAHNILTSELTNNNLEVTGSVDPGLLNNEYEKNLYKKIHQIRKDFTNLSQENDYKSLLESLASSKKEVNEFFDFVIVNDQDEVIKKNRLELLKMFCITFDNYINFSKVESLQ